MPKKIHKSFFGFTLIELLMVISIITLLSSMLFSYVGSASAKSRDSVRLSDMKQINTATTMYYEDKGEMPISIGVSNGIDKSKTLVGAGYLSAEPKDPKTGQSYNFRTGTIGGKPVVVVSTTYERIYTTNSAGEEIPQQVGVIVGDIDLLQICSLVSSYAEIFGSGDDKFPTCDSSNTSNDQIIGHSSGHRSGGNRIVIDEEISNCSVSDVNKKCPDSIVDIPCYCGSKINNIDITKILQSDCNQLINSGLDLYWLDETYTPFGCDDVSCMLQGVCINESICNAFGSKRWVNNICYEPGELEWDCIYRGGDWINSECTVSNCSYDDINKNCPNDVSNYPSCYCNNQTFLSGVSWYTTISDQKNWLEAKSYCELLNVGGFSWTLPSYNDYYMAYPSGVVSFDGFYWTIDGDSVMAYMAVFYGSYPVTQTEESSVPQKFMCVHY